LIELHGVVFFVIFKKYFGSLGISVVDTRIWAPPNPAPFTPPKRGGAYGGKYWRTNILAKLNNYDTIYNNYCFLYCLIMAFIILGGKKGEK